MYRELAASPTQFPSVLDTAVRTPLERRGVAVLVVPGDVLVEEIRRPRSIAAIRSTAPVVRPSDAELNAAARELDAAERVTILAGAGQTALNQCDGVLRAYERAPSVRSRTTLQAITAMRPVGHKLHHAELRRKIVVTIDGTRSR